MLRRIFGPKRDEVIGEWRKLGNEELNDLLPSPVVVCDQIDQNEIGETCSTYQGDEKCIEAFGRKT